LGCAANKGGKYYTGKLNKDVILTYNRRNGLRETAYKLRRALLESNVKEKCDICGIISYWNDKPLVLQIDHKDGNPLNNRLENLRFLCPNCHSQTSNWGRKIK